MLDSIFITVFIMAFLLTILAERESSIVYGIMSLIIWLTLFVQALWIVDVGGTSYHEFGVSAISLGFVFINLVLLILNILEWRKPGVVT